MELMLSIFGACAQGVIWAVMAIGVFITYRILDYADLTVDGSLALGGSVGAILLVGGVNPIISLLAAMLAGMVSGAVTGILNTVFKIPTILSGILTMISLYSINIRIMGKANTSLLGRNTIFSLLEPFIPMEDKGIISDIGTLNISVFIIGVILCIGVVAVLYWFFGTEAGSALRATGDNEDMIRALGVNTDTMKITGLLLSNGLVALSGALVSQSQGYADVGMGTGTIVTGLASVIIGEAVIKGERSFAIKLFSVVCGSVIYRTIIAIVLWLGMNSSDLKLFTAVIVAGSLCLPGISSNRFFSVFYRKKLHDGNGGDSKNA